MHIQHQSNIYNFTAMKPNQFHGVDYAVVRKFKAPVEKFNDNRDLQNWALEGVNKIIKTDFGGRAKTIREERQAIIKEWVNYLLNVDKYYTPAMALLAVTAITKNLKPDTDTIPPLLNQDVLKETFCDVNDILIRNQEQRFDFNKIYSNNLVSMYIQKDTEALLDGQTAWVKIPSKKNEPDLFSANVEKLKSLSCDKWCTKHTSAEMYLSQGDFHIYLENGKPKLAIRMIDDKIHEIQGVLNDGNIPLEYMDNFLAYINAKGINNPDDNASTVIRCAEQRALQKNDLLKAVENNDYDKFLPGVGFEILDKDENGLYSVRAKEFSYFNSEDFGVPLEEIFSKIKKMDFLSIKLDNKNKNLTSLGALEEVEGSASIHSNVLKSLGKLKRIGGFAGFGAGVEDIGSLEYIGLDAWFHCSKIMDLSGLKEVAGDIHLNEKQIFNPKNFKFICKHFRQIYIEFAGVTNFIEDFLNSWGLNKYFGFVSKYREGVE